MTLATSILRACFAVLVLFPVQLRAEETQYLKYQPDMPLMQGMKELEDQSMVFDKAEGAVRESVVFAGTLSESQIRAFYARTLPELGWKQQNPDRFFRNGEQLIVKWEKLKGRPEGGAIVRFSLSPKQG